MKRFGEYITELFDNPLSFKVVLDKNDGDVNEDGVAYKFKSKKDNYLVTYYPAPTAKYDKKMKGWSSVEWIFSSKKLGVKQSDWEDVDPKESLKVFATVNATFDDYMKRRPNTKEIFSEAEKGYITKDDSRAQLYGMLMKRLAKKHGFKLVTDKGLSGTKFKLKK
tara:strand:- start:605 stop:1099 length:495 start_codon:yes stop_codon:yes gene_type:complete